MARCNARRLSDHEWLDVLNTVDLLALNFPPWGGVITYGSMPVLVVLGPARDNITNWIMGRPTNREVFLTEISGCAELLAVLENYGTYDPDSDSMIAHLPAETWEQTKDVLAAAYVNAPAEIRRRLQEAAEEAGRAAGAALGPVIESLAPVLVGALVLLGLIYLPRPARN